MTQHQSLAAVVDGTLFGMVEWDMDRLEDSTTDRWGHLDTMNNTLI